MNTSFKQQNPVIVIMAKAPRPGIVKTRLRPVLNDLQCAELAICFLKDTVKKAQKLAENIIVAFSPPDGRDEIKSLLPEKITLIEQSGKDLGERMQSAIVFAESKGLSPVIAIGTDSPTLPPDYIRRAFELFEAEAAKSVLGATTDGGYYLIGLRRAAKGIFENVEWSSEKTFAQTAENARKIFGGESLTIPGWYDVDTPEDLEVLYREFLDDQEFKAVAPHTAEWLMKNERIFDLIS